MPQIVRFVYPRAGAEFWLFICGSVFLMAVLVLYAVREKSWVAEQMKHGAMRRGKRKKAVAVAIAALGLIFCVNANAVADAEQLSEAAVGPPEGTITVVMTGLRNNQGVVRVALFGSPETYNNDHSVGMGAFRKVVVPVVHNQAVASFSEMPYGDYAIKAFHDENNSGKFVVGAFGRPKVEFGYSNDARAAFGPPPFRRAKFALTQPNLSVQIKSQAKCKKGK